MRSKIMAVAAVVAAAGFGIASPANADHEQHQYGEHSGAVVFGEELGDARKQVDLERRRAPHARVDIAEAQFTQTDGLLTLDLQLRGMLGGTVDQLLVELDTDGDAQPDQQLQWDRGNPGPATIGFIDCADVDVQLDYDLDRIHIVVDRDCLPVVQPYDPSVAAPEIHANVQHLRATVYDHFGTTDAQGRVVHAKWDRLGGRHSMIAIPF